jgi:hypothetical protein
MWCKTAVNHKPAADHYLFVSVLSTAHITGNVAKPGAYPMAPYMKVPLNPDDMIIVP